VDWNKWEVDFMVKITVGVEGMACGMCEAHINDAVRNEFPVKKVTSSQKKKQTVIIAEEDIPEQKIKDVIGKAGYEAVSVNSEPYEKKGLFSAFGK
jgi:copper chaperone CopZ